EVLREARVAGCLRPIILLTGQGDGEVDIAAMKAGAADYLVKGQIDSQILERSIRYSLEQNRTLEALRESEERYALSARGANDGLWVWDLGADTVYYSGRWKEMLGFPESEIGDSPDEWFARVHPDDAFHDALTGLPNRALFMDRLGRQMERTRRHSGHQFAVLFLDLDRFKVVNDSLGHALGDLLLISVAERLRIALRATDTVARLGGDEFTILLEINHLADAVRMAERIQDELRVPFH